MAKIQWKLNDEYPDTLDCFNEAGERIAYIVERPAYCDRGRFLGNIEIGGLDSADCWPNYYMKIENAVEEVSAFLQWRLDKIPAEQNLTTLADFYFKDNEDGN